MIVTHPPFAHTQSLSLSLSLSFAYSRIISHPTRCFDVLRCARTGTPMVDYRLLCCFNGIPSRSCDLVCVRGPKRKFRSSCLFVFILASNHKTSCKLPNKCYYVSWQVASLELMWKCWTLYRMDFGHRLGGQHFGQEVHLPNRNVSYEIFTVTFVGDSTPFRPTPLPLHASPSRLCIVYSKS